MVQTISISDVKEGIKLDSPKSKQTTNVDFLELLLQDIQLNGEDKDKDILKTKNKESILKDESSNDKDEVEFKELFKFDNKESKNILNLDVQFSQQDTLKQNNLTEIKKILESEFKQKNILLSKADEKEFKKIDNLKQLMKFADKKGLNVEKLKFEIADKIEPQIKKEIPQKSIYTHKFNLKQNNQNLVEKKLNIEKDNKIEKSISSKTDISLENILKTKDSKLNLNEKKDITKQEKNLNFHKQDKKGVDSSKKLQINTDNKIDIKKGENLDIQNVKVATTKTTKIDEKEIVKEHKDFKIDNENKVEKNSLKKSIISDNKNQIIEKKENKSGVDLASLLNSTKTETKEKIKNIEMPKQNDTNLNLNNQTNLVNEVKAKSIQAKETIKHFNQNLDEAIKNYKPPVSKVNIELNPKNLGKVEVSIIQRGNNIQINMNTDQSNIQLFQNHQAEFRQALSTIGFNNIDMNFNSNQDRDRKQNQAKKSYKDNENMDNLEIGEIEIKADYKYA